MKTCTPKDAAAYRAMLLEKGLGYKLRPAAELCVAVLNELRQRDQNVFLAGRFSDGRTELLLLPPDEKVLTRFAEAFRNAAVSDDSPARVSDGAVQVAESIEAFLRKPDLEDDDEDDEVEEPDIVDYPGWDALKGRWVGDERKKLAKFYRDFESTPPGGYPPPVKGEGRDRYEVGKERGVKTYCVAPSRLLRDGDIGSSSAVQLMSEGGKIPSVRSFEHDGKLWVAMGNAGRGPFTYYFDAYELLDSAAKPPKKVEKWSYRGRKVTVRGKSYVLGSKARFVPENAKVCR